MLATSKGALAAGEARGKRAVRRLLPPELGAGEARSRRAGRRSDRRSLRPASKETLWCMSHVQSIYKLEHEQGLWQDIVKKKYLKKPCLSLLKKSPKNSPVWNQLISVKDLYTSGRKISVGRGDSTSF